MEWQIPVTKRSLFSFANRFCPPREHGKWLVIFTLTTILLFVCGTGIIRNVFLLETEPASTTGSTTSSAVSHRQPTTYINVLHFTEGVAGWSISLSEILLLALRLNAQVVEPCVEHGRLVSCEMSKHPLGHYLNLTLSSSHLWVSWTDFQHHLQKQQHRKEKLCLHSPAFRPPPSRACGTNITNYYGAKRLDVFEQLLTKEYHGTTVLEIASIVRDSLATLEWNGQLVASQMDVLDMQMKLLRVHDTYRHRVDEVLEHSWNLTQNSDYFVIHWRGEVSSEGGMDYMECARQIVQSHQRLSSPKTLLISSMSQQKSLEWAGVRKKNARDNSSLVKNEALEFLSNNGIDKLESDHPVDDLFELVVMDLDLLQRAPSFATCSISCRDHPCAACNYIRGKFPYLAVELRADAGKGSHECWPS